MSKPLPDASLDQILRAARSHNGWLDGDVSDATLRALADLLKMGPTSANCSPARIVFVKSDAAREKLKPHLAPGNVEKTMTAPVCAIIGYDTKFYEYMGQLFPHTDARSWFEGNAELTEQTAFRNSSLQGAYLMIAARSLGLDCGPMSGFNADGVAEAFFPGGRVTVNFLCNLGHGDPEKLFGRSPRFEFDEFCSIV